MISGDIGLFDLEDDVLALFLGVEIIADVEIDDGVKLVPVIGLDVLDAPEPEGVTEITDKGASLQRRAPTWECDFYNHWERVYKGRGRTPSEELMIIWENTKRINWEVSSHCYFAHFRT